MELKNWIAPSVILSGLCWYLSTGLNGESWYLLWLAPIPILLVSFNLSAQKAFSLSFLAYLIGRMSWFSYLLRVATLVPAIIFTLALPLIFAVIVLLTRKIVIKGRYALAILAYPVFFTAYEFLLTRFSNDGSAGSIAYSQADCLPVVQIASLTGILGITFLVTLIPSIIAVGWYKKVQLKFRYSVFLAILIILAVCLFGTLRTSQKNITGKMDAGLIVLEENAHHITDHPDSVNERNLTSRYAAEIATMAARGAQLIVLPERAFNIYSINDSIVRKLRTTAMKNNVWLVTGYTNFKEKEQHNSAMVINSEGAVVSDYNKVHLVKGFENQFTPGKNAAIFSMAGIRIGTAICKDLDFPHYISQYGKQGITVMCIPAWDFVSDDWLHSRMAVLRGVEYGFSEIRTARLGLLTISNCYGKVTSQASCIDEKKTYLIGNVSLEHRHTLYSRFGDWFGWLILFSSVAFSIFIFSKKSKS